jgi:uncharacterized protein
MAELFENRILLIPLAAWLISQVIKVIIALLVDRKLDLMLLTAAGGMPSAHSAMVAAITTEIGQHQGLNSPLFALSVVFAIIVMYDAAGVRRTVGTHARLLNRLFEEILVEHQWDEARLRELVGHTPLQVLAGAVFGTTLSLVA